MLKKLTLTVALALTSGVYAQGIPVIDVAGLAQAIQQLLAWEKQYQQMYEQLLSQKQQLSAAQTQLGSVTGNRNLGQLHNYIPGPSLDPALMQSLQQAQDAQAVVSSSQAQLAALQSTIDGRSRQIQQLMAGINTTTDLKGAQELAARISAEQVMVTSEGNSAAVLAQARELRLRQLEEAQNAERLRRLSSPNSFGR